LNPSRAFAELPAGWVKGDFMATTSIKCGESVGQVVVVLESFFWREPDPFLLWLESKLMARTSPFERQAVEAELENLKEFAANPSLKEEDRRQLALL
jgi:hypothetical protein